MPKNFIEITFLRSSYLKIASRRAIVRFGKTELEFWTSIYVCNCIWWVFVFWLAVFYIKKVVDSAVRPSRSLYNFFTGICKIPPYVWFCCFLQKFLHFDNRVIIFPEEAKFEDKRQKFPNSFLTLKPDTGMRLWCRPQSNRIPVSGKKYC